MRALIGQAVVSDPAISGSGGYMLVAASSSVAAADREQLAAVPQVSDYLHLASSPGVFRSFYRLPSGAWAFGQRFARGKRRGSLNRIVVYTLVLPDEILEELDWEPGLLPTCAYRVSGSGETKSFESLTRWEEDPLPRVLSDFELVPPQEGVGKRFEILASRRKYLANRWGADELEEALSQAFAVLEAGRSLLLPQNAEHEQLLALVWSALPRQDRQETPWTSHLAPGSGTFFRLANAPGQEDVRAAGGSGWTAPGDLRPGVGSASIARALTTDTPPWTQIATRWYESVDQNGLSLIRKGAQVGRWLIWLKHGGTPAGGSLTLENVRHYLDAWAIDRTVVEDPWRRPEELLRLVASILADRVHAGEDLKIPGAELLKVLDERNLSGVLLQPELYEKLAGWAGEVDADTLVAALDLALRPAAGDPGRQAKLLLAAIRAAKNSRQLAAKIAAEYLVPHPPALAHLSAEDLKTFLDVLRAVPGGLAEALLGWPNNFFDSAAGELARWARDDPKAAREAVAYLAKFYDEPEIRERPSVLDLSALLAKAGVPAGHWLPFALAEAAVIDREGEESRAQHFAGFLSRAQTSGEEAQRAATTLCRRLRRTDLTLGAAHRALAVFFAPVLASQPAEILAALSQIQTSDADFRCWWVVVDAVSKALVREGLHVEASRLRANWWTRLATLLWAGVAQQALTLLDNLSEADHKALSDIWIPKLAYLIPQPGEEAIVAELRKRFATDPKHQFELELGKIRLRIRNREISLADGVAELGERIRFAEKWEQLLDKILDEELPKKQARLKALFEVLLSSSLLPSTWRLVEQRFFVEALRRAESFLFHEVPTVERMALRKSLLLRVSHRLGQLSPEAHYDSYTFLKQAANDKRFDAVGAFLRGAASVKRPQFFERLASRDGDPALAAALKNAARDRVHRWDLALFLPQIENLPVKGSE